MSHVWNDQTQLFPAFSRMEGATFLFNYLTCEHTCVYALFEKQNPYALHILNYIVQWTLVHFKGCIAMTPIEGTFSPPKRKPSAHLLAFTSPLSPKAPGNQYPPSVFMYLSVLDTAYQRNHVLHVFLFFSLMFSRFIMLQHVSVLHAFLGTNNVPSHRKSLFSELFPLLLTLPRAVLLWALLRTFLHRCVFSFLSICQRAGLLDPMMILCCTHFWGTTTPLWKTATIF